MLEDLKKTLRHSAVYGLSRISTKFVGFILLPLYSIHFSVSEYGIIGRIETLWQILWAIYLFGLESGVVSWYTQIQNTVTKKKFLFSVFVFLLTINVIFSFVFLGIAEDLSVFLFQTNEFSSLVLYSSLIASLEAIIFLVFLLIRINEKPLMYSLYSIVLSLLNLCIQFYYITCTENKLNGIFIAKIISPAIIIIALVPMLLKNIRFGFEKKYVKELISFSFPIMLGGLILTLLNQSDRYILGFLVNSDEVGIYILGYNICGLINFLVISPFALAFTVISWNKLNETNAIRFYTKTITYLYFAVILCLIFVSLFTPHFIKIFTLNKNYWAAKNITPWIAFAMPFYGIHYITVFSFYVTKNTGYILLTYFLALSINVLLNIILIPYFSIYGAAIANFIGFFSLNYFFNLFSRKFYYIPIEWNKILKLNLTALLLIIPFFLSDIEFTILEILLKIFALFVFPFLLYLFGFYEKIELERMKSLFKSYSRRFCKSCSKF